MPTIDLRQRGEPVLISRHEYEGRWAEALASLESHRILRVRIRRDHVLIYPNQFVGLARTPSGTVRVEARFPDLLAELKRAFPRQGKAAPGTAFTAKAEVTARDAAAAVLAGMVEVAAGGLPFAYVRVRQDAGAPRGAFDMAATIQNFAAKGFKHRVVSRRSVRKVDHDLLQICQTATDTMRANELLADVELQSMEKLEIAYGLTEVDPVSVGTALALIPMALDRLQGRGDLVRLLIACRSVISATDSEDDLDIAVGRASFRFTDVDSLWERATHSAVATSLNNENGFSAKLHPLRASESPLFQNGGPDIDPDILVFRENEPWLVVDAKDYPGQGPDPAGVYQVAAYARSLGAPFALLVYLSPGRAWSTTFGNSSLTISAVGVELQGAATLANLVAACRQVVQGALQGSHPCN